MSNYLENVKKYVASPNEDAVESLVGHLGIALKNRDGAAVAVSDPSEIATIRDGYCSKTLDLSDEEANKAIAEVIEKMKGDSLKCRVTFYYLLAEVSGKMNRLA